MQETTTRRKRKNIEKDSHAYRLSHEAHLLIQALAEEQGIEPSAFLEIISRQLASERLSAEQRAQIKNTAQQIAAQRRQETDAVKHA